MSPHRNEQRYGWQYGLNIHALCKIASDTPKVSNFLPRTVLESAEIGSPP